MPLYQTNVGDRILSADINQFYNLLKGVAASGEAITLIYNGTSLIFQPSSDPSAGTRVLDIKNAAGTHLASLDFNGVLELLAAAAAPTGAVAGAVYWDTLLSALRVHDGTNWRDIAGNNAGPLPNLVLNSDFGRRTVFGLAMPEVFADLSGTTKIDGGAAGSVAANIFTQGAANNEYAWCAGSFVWRDGRASATFKATNVNGIYELRWRIDASNWIEVYIDGTNLALRKRIAAATTSVTVNAQAFTLNRWYWIEIEKQGTTCIVKIYDTLGTVPGVTKASSTLLQTLTGTVSDAGVQTGAHISITSDQAAAQWGGIATGNGGVYVETWLPESYTTSFGGTLGGQAIGFDEAADSGPLAKQWALRLYCPAASRTATLTQNTADGSATPSATYAASAYMKVSGLGGSGSLGVAQFVPVTSAIGAAGSAQNLTDGGSTSWTRKSGTVVGNGNERRYQLAIYLNSGATATGTLFIQLPQLEQGSAATAWRLAESPAAPPLTVVTRKTATTTTTSAALVEVDSRDLAANVFLPQDATVRVTAKINWANSGAATAKAAIYVDGAIMGGTTLHASDALGATAHDTIVFAQTTLAAGKHRFAVLWATTAGTQTLNVAPDAIMEIVVDSGK